MSKYLHIYHICMGFVEKCDESIKTFLSCDNSNTKTEIYFFPNAI